MTANIGNGERIVRIGVGVLLIGLAVTGTLGAWAYIGIVPLVTGLVRWCPLYKLLGIDTRRP
jgi:hypothetical protein